MAHLGSLGTSREPDALTFDYFDETPIAASPSLTDLDYLDFMEEAENVAVTTAKGRRFVKDLARLCIAPEDFDRFWSLAKKHRQSQTDVFDTLMQVVEAATARPTGQPSESSDGQQPTARRSAGGSSSVTEQLAGRPDLQLVVAAAQEALAG